MNELEKKEKRLDFLKKLESHGIETVSKHIERVETEIETIKFTIRLEKLRDKRDKKINHILGK